jgi:DnaJ-class molecular chaperone
MGNNTYREQRERSGERERRCDACQGSGFAAVMQPAEPGRRIYPARCEKCEGKGKVPKAS